MNRSRRTLLKSAPVLAGIAASDIPWIPVVEQRPEPAALSHSSFDPWVEINAANLANNVKEISRRVASRPIMAVIKNNGYGLGVTNVARLLDPDAAIAGLAVVKLSEAIALRDAGIRKPILLMGPFDEQNLLDLTARDIMPMIYTDQGAALDRASAKLQKPVPIHVCVDTGIGRVGVPHTEAAALIRDLAARKSVRIEGVQMTFSEDPDFDKEQLRRFLSLTDGLKAAGVAIGRRHSVSSFGLFEHRDGFLDMVRVGMALYGIYPDLKFRTTGLLNLQPAVALKGRVAYVKKLPAGSSAGYERAYMAKEDTWIATLPVGHADGWPRVTAKGGGVRIGERVFPVIASVSASHTIVELGPATGSTASQSPARIGDVATFFDWQTGSRPEDVAQSCGASVYDLTMHLGSLLPRRLV